MIKKEEITTEFLEKLPIRSLIKTKDYSFVKFTNKKDLCNFVSQRSGEHYSSNVLLNFIDNEITYIEDDKGNVLYEKQEILTEKEKEYLRAVIKPFREKVKSVYKLADRCNEEEWIVIEFADRDGEVAFPYFKENKYYQGMKLNEEYTLEELGL